MDGVQKHHYPKRKPSIKRESPRPITIGLADVTEVDQLDPATSSARCVVENGIGLVPTEEDLLLTLTSKLRSLREFRRAPATSDKINLVPKEAKTGTFRPPYAASRARKEESEVRGKTSVYATAPYVQNDESEWITFAKRERKERKVVEETNKVLSEEKDLRPWRRKLGKFKDDLNREMLGGFFGLW
ncbi:hypothetical protein J6590_024238 [Homalodisca vitripennis]|nr:hypothetical protein J6590_024238 [Homalodisca vitripennis]